MRKAGVMFTIAIILIILITALLLTTIALWLAPVTLAHIPIELLY
jgi:hypothetical protein